MQIVIDIPECFYEYCKAQEDAIEIQLAVKNGIPLPKGYGDLIDRNLALSDKGLCEFHRYDDYVKMRNYLKSLPTIIEADKTEYETKIITHGNCMICGKELTDGLFICKECGEKANKESEEGE